MKILMTGTKARAVGSTRTRYDYVTHVYLLRDALRKLGHEVDVRQVAYGEHLRHYDAAFVLISPTMSLSTGHEIETAWVLQELDDRVCLYFDDWSCENLGYTWRLCLGSHWSKWLKFREFAKKPAEQLRTLRRSMATVAAEKCPWPVLAPMFPWGDHDLLLQGNLDARLFWWNPSWLLPNFEVKASTEPRARRWVSATLSKKDVWLGRLPASWPILELGNKRQGQPVLKEKDVIQHYLDNWGIICAPYKKAGSGWWRARVDFAHRCGAVLYCDPADSVVMPPPYRHEIQNIEVATDAQLEGLVFAQGYAYERAVWSEAQALNWLRDFTLKEVAHRG